MKDLQLREEDGRREEGRKERKAGRSGEEGSKKGRKNRNRDHELEIILRGGKTGN